MIPEGFYIINHPRRRVPGVFDLNERGMFKTRPPVAADWGYRIIANEDLNVQMQYLRLTEKTVTDSKTGETCCFVIEESLIDLDESLMPDMELMSKIVADQKNPDVSSNLRK
jgi:hypothetical protein